MAIIFSVNCHFGPDLFGFLPYTGNNFYWFVHGYGWIFFAFIWAVLWEYLNNNDLQVKPKFKITPKGKDHKDYIPYIQIYFLVAAGGIFHQFIDLIGHPSTIVLDGEVVPWGAVWFGGDAWFSLDWVLSTGAFPCGNMLQITGTYISYAIFAIILVVGVMYYIPKENGKKYVRYSVYLFLIYFIPLLVAYLIPDSGLIIANDVNASQNYTGGGYYGSAIYLTGGEADFGVMLYMLLFFFVPLLFIYWGTYGFNYKELISEAKKEWENFVMGIKNIFKTKDGKSKNKEEKENTKD